MRKYNLYQVGGLAPFVYNEMQRRNPSFYKLNDTPENEVPQILAGEKGRQTLQNIQRSPGYQRRLKRELRLSDYGDKQAPTFDQLYNERWTRVSETPLTHIKNVKYYYGHDSGDGRPFYQVLPQIGGTMTPWGGASNVNDQGVTEYEPIKSMIGINPYGGEYIANEVNPYLGWKQVTAGEAAEMTGLEEFEHSSHLPERQKGPTDSPTPWFYDEDALKKAGLNDKRGIYYSNITPYAFKQIDQASARTFDKNIPDNIGYISNPTEVLAKKRRAEANLIQAGQMKPGGRFGRKQYNWLLKNPTAGTDQLLKYTSGVDKPNEALQQKGNKKLKRQTFQRLKPLMNKVAYQEQQPNMQIARSGGYLKNKNTYITKDGKSTRRGLWSNVYLKKKREGKLAKGGYTVSRSSERKGKTHKVTGPDGTVKYFGDPNMGERGKSKYGKEAFYKRHAKSLKKNPHFRAYARKTWQEGGYPDFLKSPISETDWSSISQYRSGGYTQPNSYHNNYPSLKSDKTKQYKPTNLKAMTKKKSNKKLPDLTSMSKDSRKLRKHIKEKKIKQAIINDKVYQFNKDGTIKI